MEQSSSIALKSLRKIDRDDWAGGAEAARSRSGWAAQGHGVCASILIKGMPDGKDKAEGTC